jgi:hypothetical protein
MLLDIGFAVNDNHYSADSSLRCSQDPTRHQPRSLHRHFLCIQKLQIAASSNFSWFHIAVSRARSERHPAYWCSSHRSLPVSTFIHLLPLTYPALEWFRTLFLSVMRICAGNYFGALKQWVSLQCDEEVRLFNATLSQLTNVPEQGRSVPFVLHSRPSCHNRQKQRPPSAPSAALFSMRCFPDCLRTRLQQVHVVCAKSRATARVALLAAAVLCPALVAAPHDPVQV